MPEVPGFEQPAKPRGAPRRLVLVRHGQTAWNAERRFQGHADVELDEVGHGQAAAVAPTLARFGPSLLWSSDLARARQTAAYVEKETGLVARLDARLREFDVGERTGLTFDEAGVRFQAQHEGLAGAETPQDVLARMMPAYDELLAVLAPGETAVVVSHGACLRLAVARLLGWGDEAADSLRTLVNCALAVLDEVPGPGAMRLHSWNVHPDFAAPGRAR
ncbi:histidine phosphatase family protein [Nocardioides sp.]|uniref:histidine phosphatase family protein n=1 Tax=Nocardioides sp. TaxID=35761 RepID=UPI002ED6C01B